MTKSKSNLIRLVLFCVLMVCTALTIFIASRMIGLKHYCYLIYEGTYPTYITENVDYESTYNWLTVSPDAHAKRDAVFQLSDDKSITVTYDGETQDVITEYENIVHLLHRLGIEPAENEMIIFDVSGTRLNITIDDRFSFTTETTLETTFETIEEENVYYLTGTRHVEQEGQNGVIVETYQHVFDINGLVSTDLINRTDDTSVTEIVEVGTGHRTNYNPVTIVSDEQNPDGSGTLTLSNGEVRTYSKIIVCAATAYSGGGTTALGNNAKYGNVAVDPSVIPYRSNLFIQTTDGSSVYGLAYACDTGDFSGRVVDLYYNTHDECIEWGRQACNVYILD